MHTLYRHATNTEAGKESLTLFDNAMTHMMTVFRVSVAVRQSRLGVATS